MTARLVLLGVALAILGDDAPDKVQTNFLVRAADFERLDLEPVVETFRVR